MLYRKVRPLGLCLMILATFAALLMPVHVASQRDSLKFGAELGLNPSVALDFSNSRTEVIVNGTYQFLRVEGFTAISDFWTRALYRFKTGRCLDPIGVLNYGFAKSYRIDHSLVVGAGAGWRIRQKSRRDFIEIQAFGGYLNLEFPNLPSVGRYQAVGVQQRGQSLLRHH